MTTYRQSPAEKERNKSLSDLIPVQGDTCLDIGARDGFYSIQLVDRFSTVTALYLEKPSILNPNINMSPSRRRNRIKHFGWSD